MAITIREHPNAAGRKGGDWGTLLEPRPFEIPLRRDHGGGVIVGGATTLETTLGFEAEPSTDVWCFNLPHGAILQVDRLSDDVYACHVGVALVDGNNRRVAPLVQSASGIGEAVAIEPGFYKLIAALGIPERIVNIQLRFALEITGQAMVGLATNYVHVWAQISRTLLKGVALGSSWGLADATGTVTLVGLALGISGGQLRAHQQGLVGFSENTIDAAGHLLGSLVAIATGYATAGLRSHQQPLEGLAFNYGSGYSRIPTPPPPPQPLKGISISVSLATARMAVITFGRLRGLADGGMTGTLRTYAFAKLRGLSFTYGGGLFGVASRLTMVEAAGASYLAIPFGQNGSMVPPRGRLMSSDELQRLGDTLTPLMDPVRLAGIAIGGMATSGTATSTTTGPAATTAAADGGRGLHAVPALRGIATGGSLP